MNKPHKHAEVIKAWADGEKVEVFKADTGTWHTADDPYFYPSDEYRVKQRRTYPKTTLTRTEIYEIYKQCGGNTLEGLFLVANAALQRAVDEGCHGVGKDGYFIDRVTEAAGRAQKMADTLPPKKMKPAEAKGGDARPVMTIAEFCAAHGGISRAFFYNLGNTGRGPRMMKIGRRSLITAESAAEWRERNEQ